MTDVWPWMVVQAEREGMDVVICDTSGRLHTNVNLMDELAKCKRSISKRLPSAPHEVLLVLDGTTGVRMSLWQMLILCDGTWYLTRPDRSKATFHRLSLKKHCHIPKGCQKSQIKVVNTEELVNTVAPCGLQLEAPNNPASAIE